MQVTGPIPIQAIPQIPIQPIPPRQTAQQHIPIHPMAVQATIVQQIPIQAIQPVASQVPITSHVVRRIKFDANAKHLNQTMLMGQILAEFKKRDVKEYDVDMTALATALSNVIPRMRKVVMEMIIEYKDANGSDVVIMGKQSNVPYKGYYEKVTDTTSFDVQDLPHTLILILQEFINMNERAK
jgi:hypothetical protein